MLGNTNILTFLLILIGIQVAAQPVWSSQQEVAGYIVYQDFKKSNLYYYAPGKLNLAYKLNGEPKFKLVSMRYTGSALTGDQGDRRFFNLVQFSVEMETFNRPLLKKIKEGIGIKNIKLRPLPISNIEAFLIAPVDGAFQQLGQNNSLEATNANGLPTTTSFWTERTFTLRLNNAEAQLLWNQIEEGQLSISLSYSFYAKMILGRKGDLQLAGDTTFINDAINKIQPVIQLDTTQVDKQIAAESFPIRIQVEQFPNLLKRIDINGEIPPAYPVLAVKCYDFTDNLRPDLFLKTIDLQAVGINGQLVNMKQGKFLHSAPDRNSIQVHFPFAVRMDRPLRYKVTEYNKTGNKTQSEWKTHESWRDLIDITTPQSANPVQKKNLEIETDLQSWERQEIQKLRVKLSYVFRGKSIYERLVFKATDNLPLKYITLIQDRNTPIEYQATWVTKTGDNIQSKSKIELNEDYLFLEPSRTGLKSVRF